MINDEDLDFELVDTVYPDKFFVILTEKGVAWCTRLINIRHAMRPVHVGWQGTLLPGDYHERCRILREVCHELWEEYCEKKRQEQHVIERMQKDRNKIEYLPPAKKTFADSANDVLQYQQAYQAQQTQQWAQQQAIMPALFPTGQKSKSCLVNEIFDGNWHRWWKGYVSLEEAEACRKDLCIAYNPPPDWKRPPWL